MSEHEPVVTRTVTITETPQGVTRSITASVTGGTPWEANELLNAALTDTREGTESALTRAMGANLKRMNDAAEYRYANGGLHVIAVNQPANGFGRNLDTNEGA
jgi:hypothetical protein